MMNRMLLFFFFLSNILVGGGAATDNDEPPCRLYLGPSSVSTNDAPKVGLYAGIAYDTDDIVGLPEISIPLIDFNEKYHSSGKKEIHENIMTFLEQYLWTGDYSGSQFEGNHSVTSLIPGVGILANYHRGTYNVEWKQSSALLRNKEEYKQDSSNLHRGSISTYHNLTMRATRTIQRGEELFANLGGAWDGGGSTSSSSSDNKNTNSTEDDIYGDKLTRWDYIQADKIVDKLIDFFDTHPDLKDEQKDDIMDFILFTVLGKAAGNHARVIRSLIPSNPRKLKVVKEKGGTFAYNNPNLVKNQKWLDTYAICIDNIESKPSTIAGAGRGAFAIRNLQKGDIIAPVPTLHIVEDSALDMYDIIKDNESNYNDDDDDDDESNKKVHWRYDTTKPSRGKQLLLNYCFGHPESSLLLFPASPMVNRINHAPPEKANARITWSKQKLNNAIEKPWSTDTDSFFEMTPTELAEYHHIGITFELYALRDIAKGEEILINYGTEWENAWKEYTKEQANINFPPITIEDLKEIYKNKPYKIQDEIDKYGDYPEGIQTACYIIVDEMTDGQPKLNENLDERVLFHGPTTEKDYHGDKLYFCTIQERQPTAHFFYNYTVIIDDDGVYNEVSDVPHYAITFVHLPYTSDIHRKNVFRHPIGIPDVIFPQSWRDKR